MAAAALPGRPTLPSWAATAALAGCWLAMGPATPDLAAQVYRAGLFAAHGFAVWDNGCYSLVFPVVGSVLGVRATRAGAAVLSAALFQSLVRGRRADAACRWFAIGCVADLLVGRLTYALGVATGLAAVTALARGRSAVAAVLAVTCAATSPVAGLFLALAGVVVALAERRPRALAMSAAALARALGISLLAALLAGEDCALRPASRARRILVIVTLVAIAAWEWVDPVSQAVRARDDPSTAGAYYRPLLAELRRRDAGTAHVEVPFTRDHWETVYVARRFALARGWERQLDRRLNPLFYRRQLDPAALDRWLRANAVRYVALADAPSDPAGRPEARIVAARPSFLREVWRGGHWRLYSVRDPLPLASGAVDRVQPSATALRLRVERPGAVLVRVHWTPYWRLSTGTGCIARHGPWTVLLARRPGPFRLSADFSLGQLLRRGTGCARRAARSRSS
jgi:hypothetical protein